ncbi:MAG: hypothetical protein LBN02_06960 [Oscillospiraceae bacterium]|jgi:hypothetical protein|nr:hypothetical protein [Oscillospiraceae bacterium]
MKHTKLRHALTLGVFILIVGGFCVLRLVVSPPAILSSERRRPAKLPDFTLSNVLDARFTNGFEPFAADTFPFRETMRTIRAKTVFDVFRQTDKSGLFTYNLGGTVGAGKFAAVNEAEYRKFTAKINAVTERYLGDLNVFYAVIPDKSAYVDGDYPDYDHELAAGILADALPKLTAIDLYPALDASSFYRTDLHWDQTKIGAVVNMIVGSAYEFNDTVTVGDFRGVYAGQIALPLEPDAMSYVPVPHVTAEYLGEDMAFHGGAVYDLGADGFGSVDPYNLFLRGPQSLIVLTNTETDSARHLYIFRDSFSSSLAPLIAETGAYKTVTLIDLRYIDWRLLEQMVTFEPNSDALFLYGAQVLNDASIQKVNA